MPRGIPNKKKEAAPKKSPPKKQLAGKIDEFAEKMDAWAKDPAYAAIFRDPELAVGEKFNILQNHAVVLQNLIQGMTNIYAPAPAGFDLGKELRETLQQLRDLREKTFGVTTVTLTQDLSPSPFAPAPSIPNPLPPGATWPMEPVTTEPNPIITVSDATNFPVPPNCT